MVARLKCIALYLRVSTLDQSTDLQKQELMQFIADRSWTLVGIFEDKASGTTSDRPALRECLTMARQRKIDIIICWKLDRFFRSLKDLVVTLNELSELQVEFVSVRDQIDMTTSAGKLLFHLLAAFAEFEADVIRERVRAGIRAAQAKGKRLGRPKKINESVVLALRQNGRSLSEIARQIGMSKSSVSKVLTKLGFPNSLKNTENTRVGKSHGEGE